MDAMARFAHIYCVILYTSNPRDGNITINPKIKQETKIRSNDNYFNHYHLAFSPATPLETDRIMLRNAIVDGRYGAFKPINTAVDRNIEVED